MNSRIPALLPLALPVLALAGLVVVAPAQGVDPPSRSIQDPPHHATIDVSSGELVRGNGARKSVGWTVVWANTDWSGFYTLGTPGSEWLDWGVLSRTSGSDVVCSYQFAYATTVLDTLSHGPGVDLCTSFYDDATGWCAVSGQGLLPDAGYCFSDLPGSPDGVTPWAWIVTAILTGGYEYQQDAGPFGYTMSFTDSLTGPLLCYAGEKNWGSGADQNGQEDAFDVYVPSVASGICATYWFSSYPHNFCSWWLVVSTAEASSGPFASAIFRNDSGGSNPATYVAAPPVLGEPFAAAVTATGPNVGAWIVGYGVPAELGLPWGYALVDVTAPGGELLGAPPVFGDPAVLVLEVPPNVLLCGAPAFTQAMGFGGGAITLTNAYDLVVGFAG